MKHLLSIALISLAACATYGGKPHDTVALPSGSDTLVDFPDDDADGIAKGDTCATSYRVLRSCHCKEAEPTAGVAFPEWCRSMGYAVDSSCIANARFCGDLPACHVRCAK